METWSCLGRCHSCQPHRVHNPRCAAILVTEYRVISQLSRVEGVHVPGAPPWEESIGKLRIRRMPLEELARPISVGASPQWGCERSMAASRGRPCGYRIRWVRKELSLAWTCMASMLGGASLAATWLDPTAGSYVAQAGIKNRIAKARHERFLQLISH